MGSFIEKIVLLPRLHSVVAFAALGLTLGYAAEAGAIDRTPFEGGIVDDGGRGYGAERPRYGSERPGYGAEREYYGAENRSSSSREFRDSRSPHYRQNGSFVEFRDDAYGDDLGENGLRDYAGADAGVFPGFGRATNGSFVYFGDEDGGANDGVDFAAATDKRVVDVQAERLDRQSFGASHVAVSYSGATKIIRIASDAAASPSHPGETSKPALDPWSPAWERYCERAHPDFDTERGTFTGADGAARFCTGN